MPAKNFEKAEISCDLLKEGHTKEEDLLRIC